MNFKTDRKAMYASDLAKILNYMFATYKHDFRVLYMGPERREIGSVAVYTRYFTGFRNKTERVLVIWASDGEYGFGRNPNFTAIEELDVANLPDIKLAKAAPAKPKLAAKPFKFFKYEKQRSSNDKRPASTNQNKKPG
jgi:hypothetical protein